MNASKSTAVVLASASLALAAATQSTFAYTWTGAGNDGRWTNPSNWGGGGYPQSSSDTAVFTSSATVSLDTGSTLTVGVVNVGADATVTLNGTSGSALDPVKAAAVNGNGFVIAEGGTLVLNVPVESTGRIDKWGAGEVVVNANFTTTGTSYPLLIDNGTVTVQGSAVLSTANGTLGLGNGDGSSVVLAVKDSASVSAKDIQMPVGSNNRTAPGRIVQDGADTEVSVTGSITLGGPSGTSVAGVYELQDGTLTVGGSILLGRSGTGSYGDAFAGGRFVQSGGRAVLAGNFSTVVETGSGIDLSGGTLAFNAPASATIGAPELNLSGAPSIEVIDGQLYLPAETTFAPGTALTKKTSGSTSMLFANNDFTVDGSLTVEGGYFLVGYPYDVKDVELSAPAGDHSAWPVTLNGGIFQVSLICSRVTRPLALTIESGGKVRFPFVSDASNPVYTRSILVAHSLVVDGVAQAKGRYTKDNLSGIFTSDSPSYASVVVPYVWTGAGDGSSWSDGANWDGGAVPPSASTTAVDLSRAGGKTITLNDTKTVTCIIFNPQGREKSLTISGSGKIVHDCPSFMVGMFVGPGRELVLDVDVDKATYTGFNLPTIVGGGRVAVKRNFPGILSTESYKRGAYAIDGELAFTGTTAFLSTESAKLSGFGSWEPQGSSKIVFEDGCDVAATRLDPSPVGIIASDEWVQNGGSLSLTNFYITRYNSTARTPFAYTLNAGRLTVVTDFCVGTAYYTVVTRYSGGEFVMNGGTLSVGTFKCQRNSNYIRLNAGDVYLKSGFTDTYASGQATVNEQALTVGGATIHSTGTWTCGLTAEFTGLNGAATFDTAGYNATFSKAVSGAGGLVKNGAGILTFSGAATFTGPVVVNGGSVVFGSTVDGPADFTVRSGTLSFQAAPSATLESITAPSASDIVVSAAASGLSVQRLVIGGVVQPAGSVAVNGGTVNVVGSSLSTWIGPDDGAWSASANWTGSVPNGSTAEVDFGYSALAEEATINVDTSVTLKNLVYRHATDGASLTLAGSGALSLAANGVITVPAGNTLILDTTVNLLGKTTKKGEGTLVINGVLTSQGNADSYYLATEEGDVVVNGTVSKCRVWTQNDLTHPKVTIGADAVVSNTVSVNAGWGATANGDIVQDGGIVDMNPPTAGFSSCWYLTFGNGSYTLNGGELSLYTGNSSFGYVDDSTVEFTQNGGTLKVGDFCKQVSGLKTGSYTYTLNGGTNEIGTTWGEPTTGCEATAYLNGGTIVSGGDAAMFAPEIDVVLGGEVTFVQKSADVAVTLGSKVSGTGTIRQAGPGTLTLAGDHWFTGTALKADAGTLAFATTVDDDTTLDIAANATVSIDCEEVVVRTLTVMGVERQAGRYSAQGRNPRGRLAGTGDLVVLEGNASAFIFVIR